MHPHQHIDVGLIELLSGGKVGSAKLLAGDICAQRFNHANSLFNGLASLGEIAALLLDLRNSQQRVSFSVAVTYELEELESFVELLQRLLRLSQRPVDAADAVECGRLPHAVAYCPPDQQSFAELLQRLQIVSESLIDRADDVEGRSLPPSVTHSPPERQRLGELPTPLRVR